jgi:hypothetical protein
MLQQSHREHGVNQKLIQAKNSLARNLITFPYPIPTPCSPRLCGKFPALCPSLLRLCPKRARAGLFWNVTRARFPAFVVRAGFSPIPGSRRRCCTLENLNVGFIDSVFSCVTKIVRKRKPMNKHICLLLISIASVSPVLAGCSTARGTTKQDPPGSYVQIEPRRYNTASRDFDRPWPFGPESDVQ